MAQAALAYARRRSDDNSGNAFARRTLIRGGSEWALESDFVGDFADGLRRSIEAKTRGNRGSGTGGTECNDEDDEDSDVSEIYDPDVPVLDGASRYSLGTVASAVSESGGLTKNREVVEIPPNCRCPCLINPDNAWKVRWDMFCGVLIVYTILALPFAIGFEYKTSGGFLVLDHIIDCVFGIDVVACFCTGYFTAEGGYVTDVWQIAKRYLCTFFFPDFLSVVPVDSLARAFGGSGGDNMRAIKALKFVRLIRLFKLLRLMKFQRYLLEHLDLNPALIHMVNLLLKIIVMMHLLACLWYGIAAPVCGIDGHPAHEPCPLEEDHHVFGGGTVASNAIDAVKVEPNWVRTFGVDHFDVLSRYVSSFHFVTATMLAVGYGEIYATNTKERLVSIFMQLVGATTFGFILSGVTRLLYSANPRDNEYKKQMAEVKEWMVGRQLPYGLRKAIRECFAYSLSKRSVFSEREMLGFMPTHLRSHIIKHSYGRWLRSLKLRFPREDFALRSELLLELQPRQVHSHDIVLEAGEITPEVVIVSSGLLEIIAARQDAFAHRDTKESWTKHCLKLGAKSDVVHSPTLKSTNSDVARSTTSGIQTTLLMASVKRRVLGFVGVEEPITMDVKPMKGIAAAYIRSPSFGMRGSPEADSKQEVLCGVYGEGELFGQFPAMPLIVRSRHRSDLLCCPKNSLLYILCKYPGALKRYNDAEATEYKELQKVLDSEEYHSSQQAWLRPCKQVVLVGGVAKSPSLLPKDILIPEDDDEYDWRNSVTSSYDTGPHATLSTTVPVGRDGSPNAVRFGHAFDQAASDEAEGIDDAPIPATTSEIFTFEVDREIDPRPPSRGQDFSPPVPGRVDESWLPVGNEASISKASAGELRCNSIEEERLPSEAWAHDARKSIRSSSRNSQLAKGRMRTVRLTHIAVPALVVSDDSIEEAEETEDEILRRWIVPPTHRHKFKWDLLVGVLIIYSVLAIPFVIGFAVEPSQASIVFDIIVDVLFTADLLINFRTAFVDSDGALVTIPQQITHKYLRGWFCIDFVSVFPFDHIVEAAANGGKNARAFKLVRIVRLARFFKLVKMLKVGTVVEHIEDFFGVSPIVLKCMSLIARLIVLAHLLGCFWYYCSASLSEDMNACETGKLGGCHEMNTSRWWKEVGINEGDTGEQYVAALYWAFTTMTTVGYGDIHPQNSHERFFAIMTMISGAITFGYVVGTIAALSGQERGIEALSKKQTALIRDFCEEQGVSACRVKKIRTHYQFFYKQRPPLNEAGFLSQLPGALRKEATLHINREVINKIGLFVGAGLEGLPCGPLPDWFVAWAATLLEPQAVCEGEEILRVEDEAAHVHQEVYFVYEGSCVAYALEVEDGDVQDGGPMVGIPAPPVAWSDTDAEAVAFSLPRIPSARGHADTGGSCDTPPMGSTPSGMNQAGLAVASDTDEAVDDVGNGAAAQSGGSLQSLELHPQRDEDENDDEDPPILAVFNPGYFFGVPYLFQDPNARYAVCASEDEAAFMFLLRQTSMNELSASAPEMAAAVRTALSAALVVQVKHTLQQPPPGPMPRTTVRSASKRSSASSSSS
jgi:CRP-like cAMP-binding protein